MKTNSNRKTWGLILSLLFITIMGSGTVRTQSSSPVTIQYFYNTAGRLTEAVYNDSVRILYTYDAAGNVLSVLSEPGGPTGVETGTQGPYAYALYQNYPNPFNPSSTIAYQVKEQTIVKLAVYDVLGRKLADLVNESHEAGRYTRVFDAGTYSSGVYFYRIEMGGFIDVKKMILIK